jgi:hypothetical protein
MMLYPDLWTVFMCVQVAIKNSVDIFYFACIAPLHIFFTEEGAMEKKTFLGTYAIHSSIICVPCILLICL